VSIYIAHSQNISNALKMVLRACVPLKLLTTSGSCSNTATVMLLTLTFVLFFWLFCLLGRCHHHPRTLPTRRVICLSYWWSRSHLQRRHLSAVLWRPLTLRAPVKRLGGLNHSCRWC